MKELQLELDYATLIASYQRKVSELTNQFIVLECKNTVLSNAVSLLQEELNSLEKNKSTTRKKIDKLPEDSPVSEYT